MFLLLSIIIFFLNVNTNCKNSTCFEYSCEKCESSEYGKCTKCRKGFRLVDGTCPCANINCALCETGLAGLNICKLCKNGYYNYEGDCICDIKDCEICSENSCIQCITGYTYNITNNICEKEELNKIECFDNNCNACYNQEKGACEDCKNGFYLDKGECIEMPPYDENHTCQDGYYLDKEHDTCFKICSGVVCDKKFFYYYGCSSNKCLVCKQNILRFYSKCDNSDICTKEGCLNCITDDDCLICLPGYYLLGGLCKKCIKGCSYCENNDTCVKCLSGFELNSNKKCVLTNNFDFNINKYLIEKNKLIKEYYPDENIVDLEKLKIPECDPNCLKCYENNGICRECNSLYKLEENNKCIKYCSDINCLDCSIFNNKERCTKCKEGYILKNGVCIYNCTKLNCLSCIFENGKEICLKCSKDYYLNEKKNICKIKLNFFSMFFSIICIFIILFIIICFNIIRQNQRRDYQRRFMIMRYLQENNVVINNNSDMDINISFRHSINRGELADEFELQKIKMEKEGEKCQFCKKKKGNFIYDCGCILCNEHSFLKNNEKEAENKVCPVCEKNVKNITEIKYECNICMEQKLNVAHFSCGCFLIVCKDCYIKCKMTSNKCPGSRVLI